MTRNTDRLDMSVTFQPVNIAVMTVSDSRTPDDDSPRPSRPRIAEDGRSADRRIITDDVPKIVAHLRAGSRPEHRCRHSHRRYRPGLRQHARSVCADRRKGHSGFGELFRFLSFAKIGTSTVQSRRWPLPAAPICSRFRSPSGCRDGGTTSFATSSTSATVPAILSRSCRD